MAGYQEILTDPSYAEQVIVMTYPEIGNYGINDYDFESDRVHAKGFIVKNYCEVESHYRSTQKLSNYLKNNGVIAISGVDTRTLTTTIRDIGAVPCVVTTKEITDEIREKLKTWEMNKDVAVKCSTEFNSRNYGSIGELCWRCKYLERFCSGYDLGQKVLLLVKSALIHQWLVTRKF